MKDKGAIVTTAITGTLVALMIGIFIIGGGGEEAPVASIQGLKTFDIKDRNHVKETVKYEQTPAAGGNHDPVWLNCEGKVYDEPQRTENAVHGLEHGAVWVSYKPGTDTKEVDALMKKVEGKPYIFMSPVAEQPDQIMLTAWGNQLSVASADDSKFDEFVKAFSQSPKAPEPGATCSTDAGMQSGGGLSPGETPEQHAEEQRRQQQ